MTLLLLAVAQLKVSLSCPRLGSELNAKAGEGQQTLFNTHRFHAFFTTSDLDTVTADKTHRQRHH